MRQQCWVSTWQVSDVLSRDLWYSAATSVAANYLRHSLSTGRRPRSTTGFLSPRSAGISNDRVRPWGAALQGTGPLVEKALLMRAWPKPSRLLVSRSRS